MTIAPARPLHLYDLLDPDEVQAEIDAGYVTRKRHPELPLSIYTYSRACQYENHWTPVTTRCRGLVVDDMDGRIIAHCLPKFFNHDQHGQGHDFAPPLPDEPFEVFDKVDGSLGIVFHYAGTWHVASKGSFISDQARWAQAWLDDRPAAKYLASRCTYLAEIVYPENRIVVNNGDERTLVLLAVYDERGVEAPSSWYRGDWERLGGRVVRTWQSLPLTELARMARENRKLDGTDATGTDAEGWVVRFTSGIRTKVKIAEYVRLHRRLTGTSARDVWRALGADLFGPDLAPKSLGQVLGCSADEAQQLAALKGRAFAGLLDGVPDEFDAWAHGVEADLHARFDDYLKRIDDAFGVAYDTTGNRAAFARAAQQISDRTVRAGMFLQLDGKLVDTLIWKAIRPEASDPFRNDEEG
jgi:RNA ligase